MLVAIYDMNDCELLVNVVDSIEEASKWLGCARSTLYKSLHIKGYMGYSNYKVDLIKEEK